MKRRTFLSTVAVAPVIAAPVLAQPTPVQQPPAPTPAAPTAPSAPPLQQQPPAAVEVVRLEPVGHDAAGEMVPHFFTAVEMATLTRLSAVLQPALNGRPGAIEADVPAFLDFLIGQSPAERQAIYRKGLAGLEQQAQSQFKKAFAAIEAPQVETLMAPLRQPWTFIPPTDPIARVLREAKADVRTATTNSREFNAGGAAAGGGRRAGGMGQYVYTLE
ncbi:MAG: gluconate 2-dehydrogenase subunit 3 family protein [Vicinamibacteraceae bacterium]